MKYVFYIEVLHRQISEEIMYHIAIVEDEKDFSKQLQAFLHLHRHLWQRQQGHLLLHRILTVLTI